MKHLVYFTRGCVILGLPLIAGTFIARYVPNFWIGIASLSMACVLIYFAGKNLDWPFKRWKP
jgi:hypothetical protein